jgi:predicted N-acyltransferase
MRVRVVESFTEIDADAWNAAARAAAQAQESDLDNPFSRHEFLLALEQSGATSPRTGWTPCHLVAENDGVFLGGVACWLKTHSQGEYVFDHGWADAYARAGGHYYPKLQVSIPFTPATGPRILAGADNTRALLRDGLRRLREETGASSIHATFLPELEAREFEADGFLHRNDQQFHFINENYADFDAFLAALSSSKRKTIRRERRDALANGITIETLTGDAITDAHWDAFFEFYMDTGARKWGRPYLNRRFFSLVGASMAERIALVMAKREDRYIAGAINFIGARTLYGRNWGAIEQHPFLHFEVCYYRAIDFALARGLAIVEAGAQGEHKLLRGYRPVTTHSAHDLADPALSRAVDDYLKRERAYVAALHEEYEEHMPFRKGDTGGDPIP